MIYYSFNALLILLFDTNHRISHLREKGWIIEWDRPTLDPGISQTYTMSCTGGADGKSSECPSQSCSAVLILQPQQTVLHQLTKRLRKRLQAVLHLNDKFHHQYDVKLHI